jgi:TatD DNase family protein
LSFVDAHLHLADPGYAGKVEEVVENANQNNVTHLLSNATDYSSSLQTINLAKRYPRRILAAVGVHPFTMTRTDDLHLDEFETLVEENAEWISAIGEIGLDGKYSQDESVRTRQRENFRFFLDLAERRGLPVVVHSRQAVLETLDTLGDFHIPRILLHWYDGPIENLRLFKERGFMISIGPALLYSRVVSEIARAADLSIVLSETDGPVSYRGPFADRLTQPSFVVEVVRKLSEIKGIGLDAVRSTIFSNFLHLLAQA